jgi:hypothetical protein
MKMHQHIDKKGNVFGKAHPMAAQHKKASTQEAHDRTVKKEKENKS